MLGKKIIDGLKDAQSGNQGQEEETGRPETRWVDDIMRAAGPQWRWNAQDRRKWKTSARDISCSGWTKPPSNQVTKYNTFISTFSASDGCYDSLFVTRTLRTGD
ncbi:hypothetical protein PoB_001917000 [Plakobranchus ocellatus]|uniref:Uncharacterized protein n=1 Tax=Plakobranchus ocellatus TaxID=259542 RepID=A0AAV3ZDN1_9GAST|nr:hypothetical protein PoB_001917000 [Plakobranchus ocellatus]